MLTAQLIIARAVHIGASILLAGIFTFDLVILAPARRVGSDDFYEIEHRLFRLAAWSIVAALLSALLWFWLEVASMSGLPLKSAFAAAAWRTVLFETQFGRVWQLRLGLIVAAFALVAMGLAKVKARRVLTPVLWLVSVVFLVSLAWISHAAAASVRSLGLLGDMLHLCAAGWVDWRTGTADDFPGARACAVLVRRNRRSGGPPFFHTQPVLRERSRRQRNFQ